MPRVTVTTTPTAVSGLTEGTDYLVQNQSRFDLCADLLTSAPANNSAPARIIGYRGVAYYTIGSGESLYLWYRGDTARGAAYYAEAE